MRKYAREGNTAGLKILAKEVLNLRKQKERMQGTAAKIGGLQSHAVVRYRACSVFVATVVVSALLNLCLREQAAGATLTMATAMGSAATVMATTNAAMAKSDVVGTMTKFATASQQMAMTEDMMDDYLAECVRTKTGSVCVCVFTNRCAYLQFDEDEEGADDIIAEALAETGLHVASMMVRFLLLTASLFVLSAKV